MALSGYGLEVFLAVALSRIQNEETRVPRCCQAFRCAQSTPDRYTHLVFETG